MPSTVSFNDKHKPENVWVAVEDYLDRLLIPEDRVVEAARKASAAAGLPDIAVSPSQGKLLHLLARMRGARRILEIGTLGGYSTIWMARALPRGGRLVTLEFERKHFEVARANLARAGLTKVVEQRLGPAIETLPQLAKEKKGPFDFVFIDADKERTAEYFAWAVKLAAPGAAIVVDNVIRDGRVADGKDRDPRVRGIRRFLAAVAAEPRVTATALQTVGGKGYDGFTLAVVSR
ncbi:MAG TPA: O-methyltransferase [Acidobacteriaceae bacterium]|nr:O-methyltransferase [Acidobacteriaceae bacterium]